jgi:hypothetical protein
MSKHPLNLALRFALELAGLWAYGYWGWRAHAGLARWLWTLGLPLLTATLWGVFRVDNEPNKAPVRVPGWVRLLLEVAYFGGAAWLLNAAGRPTWSLVFGLVVVFHYLISYDRYPWLLRQ